MQQRHRHLGGKIASTSSPGVQTILHATTTDLLILTNLCIFFWKTTSSHISSRHMHMISRGNFLRSLGHALPKATSPRQQCKDFNLIFIAAPANARHPLQAHSPQKATAERRPIPPCCVEWTRRRCQYIWARTSITSTSDNNRQKMTPYFKNKWFYWMNINRI